MENPILQNLYFQLSICNLIIVLKITNVNIYIYIFLVVACDERHFQRGVCVFLDGGARAQRH